MKARSFSRIALFTGGVVAATSFFPVLGLSAARADEKTERRSKQYKTGAAVLGAAAVYFGLKSKKTVPAIVAGAGAYYAYKKGEDLKQKADRDRYGYGYPGGSNAGDVYPDDNGYGYPSGGGYANYPDDNGYGNDYNLPYPVGGDDYGYDGGYNGGYAGLPGNQYPDYAGLKAKTKTAPSKKRVAVK